MKKKRFVNSSAVLLTVLLLASCMVRLSAQVISLKFGRIEADLKLDGGTNQSLAFSTFFNDPTEEVGSGVGSVDGTVNMSGRSPIMGETYPAQCGIAAPIFTYPSANLAPLFASGSSQPTPTGPHTGKFVMLAGTGQKVNPGTGLPITPGMSDDECIPYWVDLRHDLAGGRKNYWAESFRSDALVPWDVANSFPVYTNTLCEAVGAIRLRLRCWDSTNPQPTDISLIPLLNAKHATIKATLQTLTAFPCLPPYRDPSGNLGTPPGSLGTVQARVDFTPAGGAGVVDETFLVRAGRSYTISASFTTGDADGDIDGAYTSAPTAIVPQGQIVDVDILVNPVFCDKGPGCTSATGRVEVIGVNIFPACHAPAVRILRGPFGNTRYAKVTQDFPGSPAGGYRLRSVLPSISPYWPYSPYAPNAQYFFQTPGGFFESMELSAPARPFDCADPVEDLGDLFVVDPGYVKGRIRLEGPACGTQPSCLQMIKAASELDSCTADHFWYGEPYVSAGGWGGEQGVVYGSTKGGPISPTLWSGSYEVALGAPNRATASTWNPGYLTLPLTNGGQIQITDRLLVGLPSPPQNVHAGVTYTNDHDYCFSEVKVTLVNESGVPIASPSAGTPGNGLGVYVGVDPLNPGQLASYTVYAGFAGTPVVPNYTTGNAKISMCLPMGDGYLFTPSVGYSIGGTEGRAQFAPFPLTVGCKQCISVEVTTNGVGPLIKLTNTVTCTSFAEYVPQGSVCASENHVLTNISYALNGGARVTLCSGPACGSVFDLSSASIPLAPCDNTITISATDDQGLNGSTTYTITHDSTPPILVGCTNIIITTDSTNGAAVNYNVAALDGCDASPMVSCVPSPGLFPVGQTFVNCTAVDDCSNTATCSFAVTVELNRATNTNCCDGCEPPYPASFTVTVLPGFNYLVNPLCHGTNNSSKDILPSMPAESRLITWNKSTQTENTPLLFDGADWIDSETGDPSSTTLPPGEGFILFNPGVASFTITFTGCEPTCPPRCPKTNDMCLVGNTGSTPGMSTWETLFGTNCPPICGSSIRRFNSATQSFEDYVYLGNGWSPSTPTWPNGTSVFVFWQPTNCESSEPNCCDGCVPDANGQYPASFTVTVPPGWNALVNPLCHGTNNLLIDIIPNAPVEAQIVKWDKDTQTFTQTDLFDPGLGGWVDPNTGDPNNSTTLPPGEGFFLYNPGPAFTITYTGCEPQCPPRCPETNDLWFVGHTGSTQGMSTWETLFGTNCPPQCGSTIRIFNGGIQIYQDYVYLGGNGWSPSTPTWPNGNSVFVFWQPTNCEPCETICATDKTVECGSVWAFDPPSSSCSNATIAVSGTITNSECPMLITRTWSITEASGHTTTCSQTVMVIDTVAPVLGGCVDVLTNGLANTNGNFVSFNVTAPDACDGAVPVTCVPPSGSFFHVGSTVVNCAATDRCGNVARCSFTVSVRSDCAEISNERFTCSTNGQVHYQFCVRNNTDHDLGHLTIVNLPAGVTAAPYFISLSPPLPPGETRCVTVTLSGLGARTNLCFRLMAHSPDFEECCIIAHCATITRSTPQINCPENITIEAGEGRTNAVVNFTVTASGSFSNSLAVVCTPRSGSVFPCGATIVTCTARDACGDTLSCSVAVTVRCDDRKPCDLFIQDTPVGYAGAPDLGNEPEPNMISQSMWQSRGIWVHQDCVQLPGNYLTHQNPRYGQQNCVFAEVKNRGAAAVSGAKVEFYYANASLGLSWQAQWTLIGTYSLPTVSVGGTEIAQAPWFPPGTGHYCLIARIVSDCDPMTTPEGTDINANVRANNNLAWRNVNVMDCQHRPGDKVEVRVRNFEPAPKKLTLVFTSEDGFLADGGTAILSPGSSLFQRWQNAGGKGSNIQVINGNEIKFTGSPATFEDVPFGEGEERVFNLTLRADQPMLAPGASVIYHAHLLQKLDGASVGGVSYTIAARGADADTDGDGIKDIADPDDDNDGVPDGDDANPVGELDCPPAALTINRTGEEVTITWGGLNYRLQSVRNFGDEWTDVPGASSPYVRTTGGDYRFYRLICQ